MIESSSTDEVSDEWAAALQEQSDQAQEAEQNFSSQEPSVQPLENDIDLADYANADPSSVVVDENLNPDLDVILDIPVTISMQVGNTSISIRNLLQLNQGSVIELDRLAGEPLDVLVNGTLIAHGEVVVVNEKFGIRMTDIISPSERIKRLR